jgi:hypothetical protein
MCRIKMLPALFLAAVIALGSVALPTTGFAEVNIQINGYLPAPPGVRVYQGGGRPYYIHGNRRVYMKKDMRHRQDNRRRGQESGEREDHGRNEGHGR